MARATTRRKASADLTPAQITILQQLNDGCRIETATLSVLSFDKDQKPTTRGSVTTDDIDVLAARELIREGSWRRWYDITLRGCQFVRSLI